MKPLRDLRPEDVRHLEGLFFDLDDTVLTHGVLGREAYGALWDLHDAGLRLVAVTGRPSGWAEVLVRQWPIEGAVTENGAVFVVRDASGRGVEVLGDGTAADIAARRARLDALVAEVARRLPEVRLADDVRGRRADVAWDIAERVRLRESTVAALAALVLAAGARTVRSSVHLHATFERDDKASGATRFARERFGLDPAVTLHRWAFAGDSANDAACFAAIETTFGVANVRSWVSSMSVPPRFVAPSERGTGFAEIARAILDIRRA